MLFVGRGLTSVRGDDLEPALIDPALPVGPPPGASSGDGMTYWPSYARIRPEHRAAYLEWLVDGRLDPSAYIGYVFLYFYGLERRVLDPGFACGQDEMSDIAAEVERLLAIYHGNGSFNGYATRFLETILLHRLPERVPQEESPHAYTSYGVPSTVRRAMQRLVTEREPIPGALAYAWAVSNPNTRLPTPAQRCRADFQRLFLERYPKHFGAGLRMAGRKGRATLTYNPASSGFAGAVQLRFSGDKIPRAIPEEIPAKLQELVDDCASALDSYSRWIGRNPGLDRSLSALALLPAELIDDVRRSSLSAISSPVEAALGAANSAILPGRALLSAWPPGADGKLGKADFVGLAQLLEKLGFGIEPDVRFRGARFAPDDPVVVFRLSGAALASPSPEYNAATLLLHLAVMVAMADGTVSSAEEERLLKHLETSMKLTPTESERLDAHFRWLVQSTVGFTGLTKRLAALSDADRESLGEFLVTVAGADGVLAAAEVQTLERIYARIGMDPGLLYSHIHAMSTGVAQDAGPVTVVLPSGSRREYRIPAVGEPSGVPLPGIRLNEALIQQKLQQTAAVSALLGNVFAAEGDELPVAPALASVTSGVSDLAGLDSSHSELLRHLAERSAWPRAEFEALVAGLHLMPDGALDTLNEAAYEATGCPVIEEGDTMKIDPEVVTEMMQ